MNALKTCVLLEPVTRILNTRVPALQRCLNEKHIAMMVEDQVTEYEKHKCFSMVQSITIGILDGERFTLDGQHRLVAFSKMQQLGMPIHEAIVPIVVYNASSKEELSEYYNRINKHMPIHPFETDAAWVDYGKEFVELFTNQYGSYIKHGKSCRCPHIALDELKSHLHARNLNNRLTMIKKTSRDLWDCVVALNSYMHNKAVDQMCPKMKKRLYECEAKALKNKCTPCYLGAWRKFEWLDIALYKLDHPDASLSLSEFSQPMIGRAKIPAVVREQVWKKHNTNTCDEGECFVCRSALRFCDMECGHIVAHALGGATTVDNLMPVCKTCNRDMGIMNMMLYKNMLESMCQGDMDIDSQ